MCTGKFVCTSISIHMYKLHAHMCCHVHVICIKWMKEWMFTSQVNEQFHVYIPKLSLISWRTLCLFRRFYTSREKSVTGSALSKGQLGKTNLSKEGTSELRPWWSGAVTFADAGRKGAVAEGIVDVKAMRQQCAWGGETAGRPVLWSGAEERVLGCLLYTSPSPRDED